MIAAAVKRAGSVFCSRLGSASFICLLLACTSCSSSVPRELNPDRIEVYSIDYSPNLGDVLLEGFALTPGSGLEFARTNSNGANFFYAVADKGPKVDLDRIEESNEYAVARESDGVYLKPDFTPFLAEVRVYLGEARIVKAQPFRYEGKLLRGRTQESCTYGFPHCGFDPESVSLNDKESVWIGDETGPSLSRFNLTSGELDLILTPGKGLPEVFSGRKINRGIEATASTGDGSVLVLLQSARIEDERFVPAALVHPADGTYTEFLYPVSSNYKSVSDMKIGAAAHIRDQIFWIIEQGVLASGQAVNLVREIDLRAFHEQPSAILNVPNAKVLSPRTVLNLRNLGWKEAKAEGLAYLPDLEQIVVTSDADFGVLPEGEMLVDRSKRSKIWFISLSSSR